MVIEDVVTTGGSTREVIDVAAAAGVRVLGAGSIIDRSGGRADLGVPRVALATLDVVAYPPEECPLCKQGIPVVKPGSRDAVVMRRIRITVSYDGTNITAGRCSRSLPTIQSVSKPCLRKSRVAGEGRGVGPHGRGRACAGAGGGVHAGESHPGGQSAQGDEPSVAA